MRVGPGLHAHELPVGREADVLEAIRSGDVEAFAVIYEMHHAAVERLARRLCRDRYEADDVVSDVFCNTLRAIVGGAGPRDEARAYLLRAVRHTVVNLRTRKDAGRAVVTTSDAIDRPAVDEPELDGDALDAWRLMSPRLQRVLWSVEVHGDDTAAVAEAEQIDRPAAASLVHRARRALRRSYLRGAIRAPLAGPSCRPIRELLPSVVDDDVTEATARRVHRHAARCAACNDALAEVQAVRERLAGHGWWLFLAPTFVRGLGGAGASVGGIAGVAPTVMLVGLAGAAVTVPNISSGAEERSVEPPPASTVDVTPAPTTPVADDVEPGAATPAIPSDRSRPAAETAPTATSVAPSPVPVTSSPKTPEAESHGPEGTPQPTAPAAPPVASVAPPATPDLGPGEVPSEPVSGSTGTPVDDVVAPVIDQVVEPVIDGVVAPVVDHVVEPIVDGVVAPVVEPVVDGVVAPVVDGVVAPVVDGVVAPVVDDVVEPIVGGVVTPLLGAVAPGQPSAEGDASQPDTASPGGHGLLGSLIGPRR